MRRPVDHAALSAAGYFSELGVTAGTDARFHLSTADLDAPIRVVRLDRAVEPESTPWIAAGSDAPLAVQSLDRGSWLAVETDVRFRNAMGWTLELEFRLAAPAAGRTLIEGAGLSVGFASDGTLILEGTEAVAGQILPSRQWLNARLCRRKTGLSLVVTKGDATLAVLSAASSIQAPAVIHVGADRAGIQPTLNLGIGRIGLYDATEQLVDAWRFPPVGCPDRLASIAGSGVLKIHNAPTFGLRSPR